MNDIKHCNELAQYLGPSMFGPFDIYKCIDCLTIFKVKQIFQEKRKT